MAKAKNKKGVRKSSKKFSERVAVLYLEGGAKVPREIIDGKNPHCSLGCRNLRGESHTCIFAKNSKIHVDSSGGSIRVSTPGGTVIFKGSDVKSVGYQPAAIPI